MTKAIKSFLICAVMAIGLVACDSIRDTALGPAETDDLRAYRAFLIYEGLATMAQTTEDFRNADAAAHDAIDDFYHTSQAGEDLTLSSTQTRKALHLYAAAIAGKAGINITGLDLKSAVFKLIAKLPKVGVKAIEVRRQMKALDQAGRDPTDQEWALLKESVDQLHSKIQGVAQ